MDKLRYIATGFVSSVERMARWAGAPDFENKRPLLLLDRPDKTTLMFTGSESIDKFVYADKLREVAKVRLMGCKTASPGVLHFRDSIAGFLSYPFEEKQRLPKRGLFLVKDAIIEVLKGYGIRCVPPDSEEPHHNDLFVNMNDKAKKFAGIISKVQSQKRVLGWAITFEFPLELAREVFRLNTGKFTKKGDVGDIGDIVCGLYDVKPDLDIDEFRGRLAEKIAEKFGWKLEVSKFTETEQAKLDELAIKLDTREWTEDGVFPTT